MFCYQHLASGEQQSIADHGAIILVKHEGKPPSSNVRPGAAETWSSSQGLGRLIKRLRGINPQVFRTPPQVVDPNLGRQQNNTELNAGSRNPQSSSKASPSKGRDRGKAKVKVKQQKFETHPSNKNSTIVL